MFVSKRQDLIDWIYYEFWEIRGGFFGLRGVIVFRSVAVVACTLIVVACATITRGTTQLVAIDTPGAPGATCTLQTQSGPQVITTSNAVTLNKGSNAIPIQCTKDCYLVGSSIVPVNTEAMAAGNVILGGVIGLGVDAATGAMNKYPDVVTVAMTATASTQSAAASSYIIRSIRPATNQ
jgi:hypothetical protein